MWKSLFADDPPSLRPWSALLRSPTTLSAVPQPRLMMPAYRRPALRILRMDVGAALDQQRRSLGGVASGRPVQRRPAFAVLRMDVGAALDQQRRSLGGVAPGRPSAAASSLRCQFCECRRRARSATPQPRGRCFWPPSAAPPFLRKSSVASPNFPNDCLRESLRGSPSYFSCASTSAPTSSSTPASLRQVQRCRPVQIGPTVFIHRGRRERAIQNLAQPPDIHTGQAVFNVFLPLLQ